MTKCLLHTKFSQVYIQQTNATETKLRQCGWIAQIQDNFSVSFNESLTAPICKSAKQCEPLISSIALSAVFSLLTHASEHGVPAIMTVPGLPLPGLQYLLIEGLQFKKCNC